METKIKNRRLKLIESAARNRHHNVAILLENVHDVHNMGAVVRSCDAVGVKEIHILQTDRRLHNKKIKLGKRSSSGARKWVDVYLYYELAKCVQALRKKYDTILVSSLGETSTALYSLDLTKSMVLCFGNEKEGATQELIDASDGCFFIPQVGFVQSLNISVACAVTLYELFRQRDEQGTVSSDEEYENTLADYLIRHENRTQGEIIVVE